MTRTMAIFRVVGLGALGALAGACTTETRCDYIDKEVADPLRPTADDLSYCWQGYDEYGLFVFRFQPNGQLWVVESPSSLMPTGNEQATTWELIPNPSIPNPPPMSLQLGTELFRVEVNTTTLILGGTTRGAMRRAICSGFGFEIEAKRCRE